MAAMTETGALTPGDVRRVLLALAAVTLIVESAVALVLGLRFWTVYDYGAGQGALVRACSTASAPSTTRGSPSTRDH